MLCFRFSSEWTTLTLVSELEQPNKQINKPSSGFMLSANYSDLLLIKQNIEQSLNKLQKHPSMLIY